MDDLWDLGPLVDQLVPLRAEILDGDLRPLYLAHLAASCDMNQDPETTTEGPVPAGLDKLTEAQRALAELYGLGDALLAAAASVSPPLPSKTDAQNPQSKWLQKLPETKKNAWLLELMADPNTTVRTTFSPNSETSKKAPPGRPCVQDRTLAQLQSLAAEIGRKAKEKAKKRTPPRSVR